MPPCLMDKSALPHGYLRFTGKFFNPQFTCRSLGHTVHHYRWNRFQSKIPGCSSVAHRSHQYSLHRHHRPKTGECTYWMEAHCLHRETEKLSICDSLKQNTHGWETTWELILAVESFSSHYFSWFMLLNSLRGERKWGENRQTNHIAMIIIYHNKNTSKIPF